MYPFNYRITIVIPTLGRDRVVVDTVSSLSSLDAKADAIIVVDQTRLHDPDTEAYLKEEHRSGRIRWIRHQPPGVVGAMNRGLQEAKGDIVLFLDDDIIPDANLVAAHRQAYVEHPEAWAVVGQVIQPEDRQMNESINRELDEFSELRERPRNTQKDTEGDCLTASSEQGEQQAAEQAARSKATGNLANYANLSQVKFVGEESQKAENSYFPISTIRKIRGFFSSSWFLRRDLDFKFNGTEPAWVENVMAGNLSVKRDKALALGGFDENFIPPVSYRFETEFAKRIIAAGGRVRFEPAASIRHLRAARGGTRSLGSHLTSASPLHGVGDYYYALRCGRGWERIAYMLRRPFREVCTKFHLLHPWWIPLKFIGELRALVMVHRLHRAGARALSSGDDARVFYNAQYAENLYAAYDKPTMHPFHAELNRLLALYGLQSGKWLEVGCGRGLLQDVVADYTGADVAATVAAFIHKPFCCARAEALPFEDGVFDGLWSYAVLEHVEIPEQALLEMRRVLKPGGVLLLAPAWQCRPWAASDYAWKPWHDLSLPDRLRKALIPVREAVLIRACSVFPRRLFHLLLYYLKNAPMRFYSRPLAPNYSEYKVIDADARHHMDPFDAILWFRSQGDRVLSPPGWIKSFLVRTGTLVIKIGRK